MKRKTVIQKSMLLVVLAVLAVSGFGVVHPASAQGTVNVSMEYEFLRQGSAGIIRLTGPDITGATAFVFGRGYPFFQVGQGYACLLSVSLYAKIQDYPMSIVVDAKDGKSTTWEGTLKVAEGQFIKEPDFLLPTDKLFLLSDDIQNSENARLLAVYSNVTQAKYWDGLFKVPVTGKYSSPFGTWRTFNGGVTRRHTGYDFIVPVGTPVLASASGRVVFSGWLDIHGNNIIVDHGWGVYSEYAHMSQRFVVPGQFVLQGDVLGLSGNTGRSTGPHVHWEISVNDNWVNPVDFMQVKLPN